MKFRDMLFCFGVFYAGSAMYEARNEGKEAVQTRRAIGFVCMGAALGAALGAGWKRP